MNPTILLFLISLTILGTSHAQQVNSDDLRTLKVWIDLLPQPSLDPPTPEAWVGYLYQLKNDSIVLSPVAKANPDTTLLIHIPVSHIQTLKVRPANRPIKHLLGGMALFGAAGFITGYATSEDPGPGCWVVCFTKTDMGIIVGGLSALLSPLVTIPLGYTRKKHAIGGNIDVYQTLKPELEAYWVRVMARS